MNESTLGEIVKLQEQLERDASTILGRALFGFSRLDFNIGLMVVSILSSTRKQSLKVDRMRFYERLRCIKKYVEQTPEIELNARSVMISLLCDAEKLRKKRNQLIHGRWGLTNKGKVLNIVGLPGSNTQRTIEYTLEELESFVEKLQELDANLSKARRNWHLP